MAEIISSVDETFKGSTKYVLQSGGSFLKVGFFNKIFSNTDVKAY